MFEGLSVRDMDEQKVRLWVVRNYPALDRVWQERQAHEALGITGFTRPTMYRWIRSDLGRDHSLYPFAGGHYLGSGAGDMVVHEAGLDGDGQFAAIKGFLDARVGQPA